MNKRSRKPRQPAVAPDAVVFSVLGTAHALEERLEAAVGPLGLSLAKAGLLASLADAGGPMSLSDLADNQHCVRSNITQLVDRLEQDGLVRRRHDPADRRGVLAELTPAGVRAHAQAMRALKAEQQAIVSALGAADAVRLKAALRLLAG
jgi:DNA-binding MarR family transcriptional regulator